MTVEYVENKATGKDDLNKIYAGQKPIGKMGDQKYLGFVISNKGDNMANINAVKKKYFGVMKKIINKLKSLNLQEYYLECSLILMNSILRGSILYASNMYY